MKKKQHKPDPLPRPVSMQPITDLRAAEIADELTNIGVDDRDRQSLIILICGIAAITDEGYRYDAALLATEAIYRNISGILDEVGEYVAGVYNAQQERSASQ